MIRVAFRDEFCSLFLIFPCIINILMLVSVGVAWMFNNSVLQISLTTYSGCIPQIWCVVFLFSFDSKYLPTSFVIYSLTHVFKSVLLLLNFQIFADFPAIFQLWISSSVLVREHTLNYLNLLKFTETCFTPQQLVCHVYSVLVECNDL